MEVGRMRTEVWFEKIERAVHRVRQRNGSLTVTQALSQALEDDAEARALYDTYCARKCSENVTPVDREQLEHRAHLDVRASNPDWSAGGVLVEVARLRSVKLGTDYADELEAVMRAYPNLAYLYRGGSGTEP
jgi:hypothetical protein